MLLDALLSICHRNLRRALNVWADPYSTRSREAEAATAASSTIVTYDAAGAEMHAGVRGRLTVRVLCWFGVGGCVNGFQRHMQV